MIIPADIYTYQVTTQWVPFAFADQCLLNGLFLQSCRKIAALEGHPRAEYYKKLALKYKIACIQLLKALVSSSPTAPSDTLIAGALWLALDEVRDVFCPLADVSFGSSGWQIQEQNLLVATSHVRAVELMVELRGGRHSLGLEGFLGRLVSLCSFHVGSTRLGKIEATAPIIQAG